MEKQSISGKRRARKLAVQALYQWSMSGHELSEIETQFRVANNMDKVDSDYFCRLLYGIPEKITAIESGIEPLLDRPITTLNPVELAVLRLGAFELLYCLEIPYKVVLDEAISLAREFGSQDGHRYVNGVLNNLARQARAIEINAGNE
ncbi:transcription antitermination factor NusB [Legionella taurinensis]|uniref:Transcription antitermination protein NusB n=1 Tax=Legionella taurinensis TaxID=70611 RepID=A0A3A5L7Q9_9GAMM|nr:MULTISPECIES: transcription antitermination factor NusB [Legionella]MDX1836550.1 transcription antitermination factor NusB [Legionella taurinensis]PUT42986.1 transcription antitermination factor NusB [Legionella taurinensis]PUT45542.1 transcription antitermination factor NusB [Legionella taurinensis]PUT46883.1 transcription antitermination factor NusB [Legionella taurinensis]PUT49309.1 transcription antitermination factor NusB [Legionella taurinensis]